MWQKDPEVCSVCAAISQWSLYLKCIYFTFPHQTSFCFILIFSEVNSSSKLRARPRPAHWNFPCQGASLGSGSAQLTGNEVPYAEGCNLSYSYSDSDKVNKNKRGEFAGLQPFAQYSLLQFFSWTTTVTWKLTQLAQLILIIQVKVGSNKLISLLNTVILIETFSEPKWRK